MRTSAYDGALRRLAERLAEVFLQGWHRHGPNDWEWFVRVACESKWTDDDVAEMLRDIHVLLRDGSTWETFERDLDRLNGVSLGVRDFGHSPQSWLCRLACLLTEWLVRIEGREEWDREGLW
jgi:hypothetical protein